MSVNIAFHCLILAIGLAGIATGARAQYYPASPYPPGPPVYRAPLPADDAADEPDVYVPAPPGSYGRLPASPPYPADPLPSYGRPPDYDRQALPPPVQLPQRNYGGLPERDFGDEPVRPPVDITPRGPIIDLGRGPGTSRSPGAPNNAVAALPPDYQPEVGERKELPENLRRQLVNYPTREPAGTLVIDTPNTYLYLVLGGGQAIRYGIGVGREGFTWSGAERISKMAEWPDWHPPTEMIERQPYLPRFMAGGESNPLGARALYLGKTLYRIHGTNQPSTIGTFVSSGCIRLTNEDIADLYSRVQVGTRVVVLPGQPSTGQAVVR